MATTYKALSAENYEHFMGRWSRELARQFLAFSGLNDGERVLEVGCGTGSLTFAMMEAAKLSGIDAIDLAEVYVDAARAKSRNPRIRFHIGDAAALPFDANSFDRAVCQLVLQFVPDAEKAIAEMVRTVRPDGVVSAAVWDTYGGVSAHRMFWDTAVLVDAKAENARRDFYFRPMTAPGDLQSAWESAGLRNVVASSLTIRMNYADFEDYWGPIRAGEGGLGKYVLTLTPEGVSKLADALRRAFLAGKPDGARSFAAVAWVCKGTVG